MAYKPIKRYAGYYLTVKEMLDGHLSLRATQAGVEFIQESEISGEDLLRALMNDIIENTRLEFVAPAVVGVHEPGYIVIGAINGDHTEWVVEKAWYCTGDVVDELLNGEIQLSCDL